MYSASTNQRKFLDKHSHLVLVGFFIDVGGQLNWMKPQP